MTDARRARRDLGTVQEYFLPGLLCTSTACTPTFGWLVGGALHPTCRNITWAPATAGRRRQGHLERLVAVGRPRAVRPPWSPPRGRLGLAAAADPCPGGMASAGMVQW
eukprot:357869-Chlamydomonas_euryale.AAC.3